MDFLGDVLVFVGSRGGLWYLGVLVSWCDIAVYRWHLGSHKVSLQGLYRYDMSANTTLRHAVCHSNTDYLQLLYRYQTSKQRENALVGCYRSWSGGQAAHAAHAASHCKAQSIKATGHRCNIHIQRMGCPPPIGSPPSGPSPNARAAARIVIRPSPQLPYTSHYCCTHRYHTLDTSPLQLHHSQHPRLKFAANQPHAHHTQGLT